MLLKDSTKLLIYKQKNKNQASSPSYFSRMLNH